MRTSRWRTHALPALLVSFGLVGAACGSDSNESSATTATEAPATTDSATTDSAAPETTEAAAPTTDAAAPDTTEAAVACDGDPIVMTMIVSLSGPLGFASREADNNNGLEAALAAVNHDCTAGRPLDIKVCDDKSDPNESTTCGREAAENGSIAIFGETGSSENGVTTSGLPGVMLSGSGQFDLINPLAYSSINTVTQMLGAVSAAKGAGMQSFVFVAPDVPAAQFGVGIAVEHGKSLGMDVQALFFPADTTDFTSAAAQVSGLAPDAIGVIVPATLPFFTALEAEGITPKDTAFFTAVALMPPDVIESLDGKAEGMYLVTPDVPAQDTTNAGIQQMQEEWDAAGITDDFSKAGVFAVSNWSKVHSLATILGSLSPDAIAALDSTALADALVAAGPFTPLASAPFDFSAHALPGIEALAPFRVFGDEIMVTQVTDGTYKVISDFGSVAQAIPLNEG